MKKTYLRPTMIVHYLASDALMDTIRASGTAGIGTGSGTPPSSADSRSYSYSHYDEDLNSSNIWDQ